MIGRAPGVGPKLALRIATELKDKAPAMMLRGEDEGRGGGRAHAPRGPEADAVSALVHLGYSECPRRRGGGARRAGVWARQTETRRSDP